MHRKADLPTKLCATCGRPFTWRKKWEKAWADVRYCSDRCRMNKGKGRQEDKVKTLRPRARAPLTDRR